MCGCVCVCVCVCVCACVYVCMYYVSRCMYTPPYIHTYIHTHHTYIHTQQQEWPLLWATHAERGHSEAGHTCAASTRDDHVPPDTHTQQGKGKGKYHARAGRGVTGGGLDGPEAHALSLSRARSFTVCVYTC